MAKTSMKVKQQRKPKFSTRAYTRCKICGRPHGCADRKSTRLNSSHANESRMPSSA